MSTLLNLSLHGSLAFLLVWALDRALGSSIGAQGRRWWWLAVPVAFLVSFRLPILPAVASGPSGSDAALWIPISQTGEAIRAVVPKSGGIWLAIWLGGAALYLLVVLIQTRGALVRWSRERLCTEPALLDLLEDCKQEAGITAPIGLVVSDRIFAPAIMGWLRPRLLLPRDLVNSMSGPQLRGVLFHELAHFRALDIPLNWLFTAVCAIHWFNPLAHLAFRAWVNFQEEAADETAMGWLKNSVPTSYGEILLHALRGANGHAAPFGALAIGESIHHLKKRITMIKHYPRKSPRLLLAAAIALLVTGGFIVRPIQAQDGDLKTAAVASMETWLHQIDEGKYALSWDEASASFQKALDSQKWVAALQSVRTPLGKCKDRKLASALHQTEVPSPSGTQKGDFVVAQFNTSFENLAYSVETVCFEKAPDGTWKASGYYIKPKS